MFVWICLVVIIIVFVMMQQTEHFKSYTGDIVKFSPFPHVIRKTDAEFYIYNNLLIDIDVYIATPQSGSCKKFIDTATGTMTKVTDVNLDQTPIISIPKLSKSYIDPLVFSKFFVPGKVLVIKEHGSMVPFIKYTFIRPVKSLNIGGITSRWVGADQDSVLIPAGNAVQGRPYIRIHNFTSQTLNLNETIRINPNSTVHFSGRDHLGVRLGSIFVDNESKFPKYKMMVPITDIYFGTVTEKPQPGYGGWQMDDVFNEVTGEPQFLLEEGYLSGPAHPLIDYTELPPVEGCYNKFVDDWGQIIPVIKE